MKGYNELELKVIECMMIEADEGDAMDIDDFLKEVKNEGGKIKSRRNTKFKLKNMLGKITCKFVKI